MDKKELQKKLNKPYSTDNWREVVQFVFPNVQILNPPMVIPIDNDKVESFRQLGNVQLHDGKSLALFELKLKANVNILRNRVELNNIVSQYIDQDQTHGVLSIFEQGGDDYRFTFSARASEFDEEEGDFKTTKTDTKRFTYVLGKNESCKTPAQRFYELSENKNKAEIKDIENAFSVEKLSKAFFKEYKDQYNAFVNYMMQTPSIFTAIYSNDDKAIRDFVKILLGRIIFIKFVQKKGWMGVAAASKKWIDGDYRFLENGFAHFHHQDLFYSTFLEPLFEALDEPNRPNDIFTVTNTRVPYLSGGLFELEDKETKNINFPAKYFEGLFEFLDRYNFTIDENDTNDHEVGIDPEMLGHIFENLLEDNKDKGAFYTPKEIVRYMCQESLKEYLKTSLENNKQWPTDETEANDFEQKLHNFVTKKDAGGIIEYDETIARALKNVKICDPAIGSGAFPMGLLNEIFHLINKLHEVSPDKVERVWELKGWQPNKVKQNIIQNSIYGVDIEKGAVDVARLRFWLSLIVDEPEPKALPHLDYKIVVGNSLVSKLDDTIIDIDWDIKEEQTDLFGNENKERQQQLLKEISAKQKLVFDPKSDEEKLSLQIRNLKIDLLVNQLDAMVKTKGVATKPTETSKTIKAQTELWLQTIGWKQQIEKLQKLRKDPNGILHFFDWKLDFPEIMNEQVTEKVGFDIVIGNPPYVQIKQIPENDKIGYIRKYKFANGRFNLFYFFLELTNKITLKNGITSFIIPDRILLNTQCKGIREWLLNKQTIIEISSFDESVFETAVVDTIILTYKNLKNNSNFLHSRPLLKVKDLINKNKILIPFSNFRESSNKQFDLSYDKNKSTLLDKIRNNSDFLGNISDTKDGIIQSKIPDILFLKSKENDFCRRLLFGKDINKYIISFDENWVNYNEIEMKKIELSRKGGGLRLRKKEIFERTKILTRQTSDRIIASLDVNNFYYSNTLHGTAITNPDFNIKFVLSILNSKLTTFYYKSTTAEGGKVFAQVKIEILRQLPVRYVKNQAIFIDLVDKILEQKQANFDTTDLEQQIDNLVYKLYELTYEEVLVVEPEFSERLSREEYDKLKI